MTCKRCGGDTKRSNERPLEITKAPAETQPTVRFTLNGITPLCDSCVRVLRELVNYWWQTGPRSGHTFPPGPAVATAQRVAQHAQEYVRRQDFILPAKVLTDAPERS